MNKLILADYYEHNLLLKKARRLRKRQPVMLWGFKDYHFNTHLYGLSAIVHTAASKPAVLLGFYRVEMYYKKGDGSWFFKF